LLSLPVSRRRYLLGRVLSTATVMALVLAACLAGFLVSRFVWPEFDVSVPNLVLGMVGAWLFVIVCAGYSYLLAVIVPSSRHFAGPIAYLLLIGPFLIYGIATTIDALKPLRPLMLQHYYNMGSIIRDGVQLRDWAVMGGVALVLYALAWWLVDRKELGV